MLAVRQGFSFQYLSSQKGDELLSTGTVEMSWRDRKKCLLRLQLMFRFIQQDSCSCWSKYGWTRLYMFILSVFLWKMYVILPDTDDAIRLVGWNLCWNQSLFRKIDRDNCFIIRTPSASHIYIPGYTMVVHGCVAQLAERRRAGGGGGGGSHLQHRF